MHESIPEDMESAGDAYPDLVNDGATAVIPRALGRIRDIHHHVLASHGVFFLIGGRAETLVGTI